MSLSPFFSSSSKVWEDIEWVYGIEEAGYDGWEIVADGRYRFDKIEQYNAVKDVIGSTGLGITVHAPYADLNLATLNYPIWKESIRQVCACVEKASNFTDRVTIHPGYMSPVGKLMPDKVWEHQKTALKEIGSCATEYNVLVCLENMIGVREFLCQSPDELLGMTDDIPGIGITLDFGHANTVGQIRNFQKIIGSVHHIHIHDNHGSHDEHLPLGHGTIDWGSIGKAISRTYSGRIVIEGRSLEEAAISLKTFRRCFLSQEKP